MNKNICMWCGVRIIGSGVEDTSGRKFCCAACRAERIEYEVTDPYQFSISVEGTA